MRPARLEDWPQWAEVRGRNHIFLKPFEPQWAPDALSADYFRRRLLRQAEDWQNDKGNYFLIIKKENNTLIGGMNINNICRGAAQYTSLGYWIDRDHEGQGYMSECMRLTLRYCFEEIALHRINAACLPHNQRSRNLLLRAGFKEEGIGEKYMQIDGKWQNHILFGYNIEDWMARQKT